MSSAVHTIVLAGRSADVWPVAALLERELPPRIKLHVIEDGGIYGPRGATVPLGSGYHTRTGIDCATLLEHCDAALSLGSVLENWRGEGSRFVTAPSGTLPAVGGVALHQLLLKMAAGNADFGQSFAPFRFAARAAEAGKMALPADAPDSPLAMLGPQVSFDRGRYAAMLRARCEGACTISKGRVAAAQINGCGDIGSVTLDSGAKIPGDFFVDCSGDLSDVAGCPEDLRPLQIVPFGQVATIALVADRKPVMPIYRAQEDGLLAITPTASGQLLTFACSTETTEETILQFTSESAVIATVGNGCTDTPWLHNLVRLGTASVQIGSMLSADIVLLQAQSLLLADCLPVRSQMQAEADAFNRKHAETVRGITDFAFAPLYLGAHAGLVWEEVRASPPPHSLQIRIDQFRSRARVPSFERDYADEQTWTELLFGMGLQPSGYDRRADTIPPAQIGRVLNTIRQQLDGALARMETRTNFLRRFA